MVNCIENRQKRIINKVEDLSEVDMNRLADLSYIDLPLDDVIMKILSEQGYLTLKDFANFYLKDKNKKVWQTGNEDRDKYLEKTLNMCINGGEYENIKIVGYENQNENSVIAPIKTGLVAYAFEISENDVIVAYRGSEGIDKSGNLVDWIDNFKISLNDTEQQEEARKFLDKISTKYENIGITGHSKGGNNAIYAAIKSINKDKIKICMAFNAPGFIPSFIHDNNQNIKDVLDKIINYQYENDIVSSVFVPIGKIIVLENKDKINIASFKNHQLYSAKIEEGLFVRQEDGKKNIIANFVNVITMELRDNLTDEELNQLIDLIEKYSNKHVTLSKFIDKCKKLCIELGHIINLLVYIFIRFIIRQLKSLNNNIDYIADKVLETYEKFVSIIELGKEAMLNSIKYNERIDEFFTNMLFFVEKLIKTDKLEVPIYAQIQDIKDYPKEYAYNKLKSLATPRFLMDKYTINSYIKVYNIEIQNMNDNLYKLDTSIGGLLREGWEGKSKIGFIDLKYMLYKSKIEKCIKDMESVRDFLEECRSNISNLELEENRIVSSFAF